MSNNFKMNKPKPRLALQSPYQRPTSGGVGQSVYNPFQRNSAMENAIRFPHSQLMMPSTSQYGFSYFQDVPSYGQQHSCTPFATPECSTLAGKNRANRYKVEDEESDSEDFFEGLQGKEQLTAAPSTSLSQKSGRQVRFCLPTKQDAKPPSCAVSSATKRWEDDSKPLRVLTGPADKIIKWEKIRETCGVLFEVVAPLVTVRPGGFRCEKMLLLRDEATPALQCLFYTIDRPLPPLEKGQLVRCVGEMLSKNRMKAYSVRPASVAEKAGLQRLAFASQRAITALMMAKPEP